jgi:hypothetical protein
MFPMLTNCPVCHGPFHAERLGCANCGSTLEGHYSLDWLGRLNREQLEFVRILVKNRGNINGVATDLKMAYNTARSRLDDIVAALGYGTLAPVAGVDRKEILERLAEGEITVEEATRLLRG